MSFTKSTLPWPLLIMSYSRIFYRFSEYKTYATFMIRNYPNRFEYHKLADFGECGIRFRDAGPVLKDIIISTYHYSTSNDDDNYHGDNEDKNHKHDNTDDYYNNYKNDKNSLKSAIASGLSYVRVRDYTLKKWNQTNQVPGYIQLDHVYSFDVEDDDDSIVVDVKIPSLTSTTITTITTALAVDSKNDSVTEIEQETQQYSLLASSSLSSSEQKIYQTIQLLAITYIWDKIVIMSKISVDDAKILIDILRRYSQNFIVLFIVIIIVVNNIM